MLMRYTLRLLTIQQFERAALLICMLRGDPTRARADLGDDRISIGLWVGQGGHTEHARTEARKASTTGWARASTSRRATQSSSTDAHGAATRSTTSQRTRSAKSEPRLVIRCRNKACEFAAGLPVCVVDEDIYATIRP